MDNQKLAENIIKYYENRKYNKVRKLLLKNKENEELFGMLLEDDNFDFNNYWVGFPEVFSKMNIQIQKKIVEQVPFLLKYSSLEIRDDEVYLEELQKIWDKKRIKYERYNPFNIIGSGLKKEIIYDDSVYKYIGPELANDKEYLVHIRNHAPHKFAEGIKQGLFDKKTVTEFLINCPSYISFLPDSLKNDFEYIAELINKISEEGRRYGDGYKNLVNLNYEQLKNEKIRDTIIEKFDEDAYNYLLSMCLKNLIGNDNYDKRIFKEMKNEDLKKIISIYPFEFIYINDEDIPKPNLFSSKQEKENLELVKTLHEIRTITYDKINNKEKLTTKLYELSHVLGNELSYEEIFQQVDKNWKDINDWISKIDDYPIKSLFTRKNFGRYYNLLNLLTGIESNKLELN